MPFCLPQILRQTHCKNKKNWQIKKGYHITEAAFFRIAMLIF
jgi:hypothetical protein